jgi:hypothetical protein
MPAKPGGLKVNDTKRAPRAKNASLPHATARCLCGAVEIEVAVPVFWAWHDHSAASRRVHGAAYATYVGCWKSKIRVAKGEASIARFEDKDAARIRSFCKRCGTPLMYERSHSPKMVNIPRALFEGRTGREPLYHIAIEELQEWTYLGERLVPLKGYPGVVWTRPKPKKKQVEFAELDD